MIATMEACFQRWGRSAITWIALFLFYQSQPGSYLLGNWDPGIYLGHGAAIARHAALVTFPDSAADILDITQTALLYPEQHGATIKVSGVYSPGPPFGDLIPQFLPGYPCLLGLAFRWGGLPAALRLDALLIAWAVVILARWAERRSGSPIAWWCTVALFGLHPVTIWFARFHTAESLALLLSAWWVTSLLDPPAARPDAPLTRIGTYAPPWLMCWTTPATWPLLLGSALFACASGQSARRRFALALTAVAAPASAILTLAALDHPYTDHLRRVTPDLAGLVLAVTMALAAALAVLIATRRDRPPRRPASATATAVRLAAASALSATIPPFAPAFADGLLVLTPITLWIVALPAFTAPDSSERSQLRTLWMLLAAMTLYFVLAPSMPAFYPWTWKRWMWWTLPLLSAAAAMAIATRATRATPTVLHRIAAPATVTATLLALPWLWCAPIATTTAWRGLPGWMDHLATRLPREAIVIADKALIAPLEFLHGRTAIPLYADDDALRTPHYQRMLAEHPDCLFALVTAGPVPDWWPTDRAQPVDLAPYEGHWIKPQPSPSRFTVEPRRYDPTLHLLAPEPSP